MQKSDNSYKQIIRSTSIFGGSQVITILIGIARNKLIALLLGAAGTGLISVYQSILDTIKSITGFGIETSGVREVAKSAEEQEKTELYKTISTVDTWSLILAGLSAIVCILCAYPIGLWLFDNTEHTLKIAILSVSLFFMVLAAGQTVILQGLRQIGYMVKSAIIWNLTGLIAAIPLYYYWRAEGIIPVFIVVSIGMFYSAYYYRRRLNIPKIKLSFGEVKARGVEMLRLGFFIASAAIPTMVGYFIIRAFLTNNIGLESVGLYQAAWSITNVYLSMILKSMGSDFYPRLCSVIENKEGSRKLINEQTYIVLILCVPAILILLLVSKLALALLYSSEFTGAASVLNWQILGTFAKLLSWPLGFILLAKGKGAIYFATEMLYLLVYLGSTYLLYPYFGFDAVGIAYLLGYVIYLPVVFVIGKKLTGFKWASENLTFGIFSFILVLLAFVIVQYKPEYSIIAVVPMLVLSATVSFIKLNKVFPLKSVRNKLNKNKK
ncbi:O-antigen translocase [Dysgonomonas macrotermitis]|uniref:Polysaccharide transporter, PST family n=1 Tax=Dysgonomonas macrotermitis TaxID=1346286 RepID=A0A1M5EPA4_9BACT|nr:O-antigen translocase [Dysgonomonas macrotermitis]SHF80862.1 polysaccharide transporter, PST family [Dysgonomonas macrotermitis]